MTLPTSNNHLQFDDPIESESTKAFAAFCIYRDLGKERSIDKAWKQYQNSTKTVQGYFKHWSSHFFWVDRCKAYDAECAKEALVKAKEGRIMEMVSASKVLSEDADVFREMSLGMVEVVQKEIDLMLGIDAIDGKPSTSKYTLPQLAAFARSAVFLRHHSQTWKRLALGIDDLADEFKDGDNLDTETE
jgi:hypothetical protein